MESKKQTINNHKAWMYISSLNLIIILVYLTLMNPVVGSEREQTNFQHTSRHSVTTEVGVNGAEKEVHMPVDSSTSSEDKDIPARPYEIGDSHQRKKRVVYGSKFYGGNTTVEAYPVLNYFVVISNAHQCSFRKNDEFYSKYVKGVTESILLYKPPAITAGCLEPYHNPKCGGSLIAPRIVLTACHCLVTFWDFTNETTIGWLVNPLVKDVWEDQNIIFRPGLTTKFATGEGYKDSPALTVTTEQEFMLSKKYYVHDKCKHIYERVYSFDFGFIFLNEIFLGIDDFIISQRTIQPVKPKWHKDPRLYAPLLTEKTMEETWATVQRHQTTCLFVGAGWDKFSHGIYRSLPEPMQIKFTWRSVASYGWCAKTFLGPYAHALVPVWRDLFKCEDGYRECATWDCTVASGRITGIPAVGDDGGPVICDGLQYALITGAFSNSSITYISPLVFNYQVSADLRPTLIELEGGRQEVEGLYPFKPTGDNTPDSYSTADREIAGSISSIFTILLLFFSAI